MFTCIGVIRLDEGKGAMVGKIAAALTRFAGHV
jgi:hypothetical protein